jgi:hypothetical protein
VRSGIFGVILALLLAVSIWLQSRGFRPNYRLNGRCK